MALLATFYRASARGQGSERVLFRVSTENFPTHFQAQALRRFSELASASLGPRFLVEFHDGAKLYRDVDAVSALARGELEMAAPGIWQFDRMVPDMAVLSLPSMYAKPREAIRAVVDGPVGAGLSRDIEASLGVVALGRWLDLGYGHLFGAGARIASIQDMQGRRIRVAGGKGNEERIRALGGIPISIPLLDLPAYLRRGLVDGVLTTYETVDSSGLDAHGIQAVFEDRQYYGYFVPIVSRAFWERLDDAQKAALEAAWATVVETARLDAVKAQEAAKANLVARGMVVRMPTEADIEAARRLLLAAEDQIAARLNVRPETLASLRRALR